MRSACKWQSGLLPSATKPEHWWFTRPDPLDGLWVEKVEPLLWNDLVSECKIGMLNCPMIKHPNVGMDAFLYCLKLNRENGSAAFEVCRSMHVLGALYDVATTTQPTSKATHRGL